MPKSKMIKGLVLLSSVSLAATFLLYRSGVLDKYLRQKYSDLRAGNNAGSVTKPKVNSEEGSLPNAVIQETGKTAHFYDSIKKTTEDNQFVMWSSSKSLETFKPSDINLLSLKLFIDTPVLLADNIPETYPQTDRLVQISNEYKSYPRYDNSKLIVTDSLALNWTITLCAPARPRPNPHKTGGITIITDSFHISKPSIAASPHGSKLYKLFVKDIKSYNDTAIKFQPTGQVIVKETWNVKEVGSDSISSFSIPVKQSLNDGKWYTPTTVSELFIMYKEQKKQSNDEGWVYGIVNLEDKNEPVKVLENGKISSCIGCHRGTKYDRVFGGRFSNR